MSDHGRFAFEPLLNLVNGRPVGMEVLRRQARDQVRLVAANAGRPTPPMLLEINPAPSAAPRDALAEGIAELRSDGFGIGFDGVGRGFGLDLLAELEPDLAKIDAHLVGRLPTDPRARAVVTALGDVCRAVGVRVCATGVGTTDQLAAVRDHGIPRAQGPAAAEPQRRPSTAGIGLPPALLPRFARQPAPRAEPRPAQPTSLAEPPRTCPAHADLRSAMAFCLGGDRTRSYDDLVLLDADGACVGVVRVTDLLAEATGSPSVA